MKKLIAHQPTRIRISRTTLAVSILIAATCSCNRPPIATLDGKNPPTFKFECREKISSFTVYEIIPKDATSSKNGKLQFPLVADRVELWTLVPDPAATTVGELQSVSYGQLPPGFIQRFPNQGPPSPLVDVRFYGATATIEEARELSIAFAVSGGKTITQ